MLKKLISVAVIGLASSFAHAQSITFTFDPDGAGAGAAIAGATLLDWAPGNNLALGGAAAGGVLPVGYTVDNLFQANLQTVNGTSGALFTNGGGGNFFTVVAGFGEFVVDSSGSAVSATNVFAFNPGSATNFFYVYANSVAQGDNLAGTGFTAGSIILAGNITFLNAATTGFNQNLQILDQAGANDHPGVTTVTSLGTANITAKVTTVDANYFPDLQLGAFITAAITNSSLVTPFNQIDPSRLFSSNGIANGDTANNIGAINGISGPNFQFQADANTSFTRSIPEPSALALLGVLFAGMGVLGLRKKS